MLRDNNYFTVQGFMRTQLKLKGGELLVYALIYGFSQGGNTFSGSLNYIADFVGISKRQVITVIQKLTEKGLIIKEQYTENRVTYNRYKAVYETASEEDKQDYQREPADKETLILEPSEPETVEPEKAKSPAVQVWQAYKKSYVQRYGVEPVCNGKTMGQCTHLIKYVGLDNAIRVAGFYPYHNYEFFLLKKHEIGLILSNYQMLLTDLENQTITTRRAVENYSRQNDLTNNDADSQIARLSRLIDERG